MKLAIADRRLALVPLRLEASSTDEGALLVHPSALLEALTELFNLLWSRAVAVRAAGERDAGGAGDDLTDADIRLLTMLVAGRPDKAIAHRLGLGLRTVRRRVRTLMDALGATTRLQLGYQAAKRNLP
jgi:DNA-binding NarL/FixJ family response regulator